MLESRGQPALPWCLFELLSRPADMSLRSRLQKPRQHWWGRVRSVFQTSVVTDSTWEELEDNLIMGDVGLNTAEALIADTKAGLQRLGTVTPDRAYQVLREQVALRLESSPDFPMDETRLLTVVFVIGVNGAGKTTTIGKLAQRYRKLGRTVVLAAADTFRAAAVEQLQVWGERAGVDVISHGQGADPGAVVYDAIRASQESRGADLLLVDTAGRLHTKFNLMRELQKLRTVASKLVHQAPHEVLLVLDAASGQNALIQAEKFKEAAGVTGIVVTKLDGSSKGGSIISIRDTLGLPIRFIGTGEGIDDIARFEADAFAAALFD